MRYSVMLLALLSGVTSAAMADDRINGLKKVNTDMCIRFGVNMPDAPKDAKLVPGYCNCVSDTYWASVPKAESDELLSTGTSARVQQNLTARMNAAQVACKKKIGF
jgi:hypothetical protein